MPTENIEPEAAAALYERELKRFHRGDRIDAGRPLFDVTLLGLGPDGHTASLFPGSSVLDERDHWVAVAMGPKSERRITLTWPALESSAHVAFLVAGKDKREILDRYLAGDESLPATQLNPAGEILVFCDAAARPREL
jgi:6-phosphogluconolactonase